MFKKALNEARGEPSSLVTTRGVAGPLGGQRFLQVGPSAVGSGRAVVDVEPHEVGAAEGLQAFTLDGQAGGSSGRHPASLTR